MKKIIKLSVYACLLMQALFFNSCQDEFEDLPGPDEQQTIVANSSTALLIKQTSSRDGSYDNIVDGASCIAIHFPYVVFVNGNEISIESKEDLKKIEVIFDELEADDEYEEGNLPEVQFPVTVSLADYTELTINDGEALRDLANTCVEGGTDEDIECIDFVYPITLYTFDLNKEQTGTVEVEEDKELRRFFAGLGENDLISLDFPLGLKLYDGTEIQVNSNAELASAIENVKEACDEDDDTDHNDDDFSKERLEELLKECPWLIREVKRDGILQTDQYFEYLMVFAGDGAVTVTDRLGNTLNGSWSIRVADHKVLLKLEFDVLVDFNLEWMVYELGEGSIKLYGEEGNRILMDKACDLVNTTPDTLREILMECSWVIKKVKNEGEELRRLLGYELKFQAEGVVSLSNGITTSEGSWEITTNAQGRLVMAVHIGDEPGLNFEWPLSDLRDDRLKFELHEGYELSLQRVCDDNNSDGDVPEIRNILMGGQWQLALYENAGMNSTETYAAYTFTFQAGHILGIATGESEPDKTGIWWVLRDSDGKLKVYLNAGSEQPLVDITQAWDFVSVTDGRLEIKSIHEGGGSHTTLVFERI